MLFEINTPRLNLAPPTENLSEELFNLMSNQVDTRYLNWEPHTSISTTKEVIKKLKESQSLGNGFHWCVFHQDQVIGLVSLIDVRRKIRTWTIDRAELSYWIALPFTGNGFATEAARAVLNFGFNQLSLRKIIIAHTAENIKSQNICEKLGFIKFAYEHDAFMKKQRWYDLVWYEFLNYNT
jgi:RimJ/RimL family protein N-acetyltransferase